MRSLRTKCETGSRLGRYELLEELGRGAMGIVFKARDPQIDRLVAIKTICTLAEDFEVEDSCRTRFMGEARAAGRLSHRGIVQVFDVGEDEATRTPYIVMEYVPGMSLSRMLAGGVKLPTESALRLAQEVAEALAYAHAQGVIHRDIKPSNIMVNDEGHAKITDLGVSKLDFGNGTLGEQTVGTPAYMAPEQLKNSSQADGRSDLFSVGVLLYCMLSGHRPFQGNSSKTLAFKINHHEPVPVTAFDLELSPAIDYVVARAMAKDPGQRYQTGTEMALDLQDLREAKKPRSWTAAPPVDRLTHPTGPGELSCFNPRADLAPTPGTTGWHASSSAGLYEPRRTPRVGPNIARNVGAWLALTITLALGYLGLRAWPAPAAPRAATAKAPAELKPVAAAVPKPMATATAAAAPGTGASAAPTKPRLEAKAEKTDSAPAPTTQKPAGASVQLVVQHQFEQARISVWVDDRLAYTDSLHGEKKKRLLVFRGVRGKQSGTVQLPPGEHRLRVRIQSASDAYDQEESILGAFEKDATRTLQVKCDKGGKKLQLKFA